MFQKLTHVLNHLRVLRERDYPNAAFEQGTGIISDSSILCLVCCHWPCVATWLMEVGGVSDAGTNGVEEGRLGEPSLPMEWVLGVSIDSKLNQVGFRKTNQLNWKLQMVFKRRKIL
ncbi:hypothetical protein TNCV_1713111 [Trichonephila clavipes]|nr:hypothetical protein TNCV_1713111 [Trichonephila clavipes]